MATMLAVKTPTTLAAIRAEALFVSAVQAGDAPTPDQVRRAVAETLRRLGVRGCAAQLAGEFGDHPETAVARMTWALETVSTVYAAPSALPAPLPRPLALAS
ncbi:MAG: hypothetical protein JWO79_3725 [Actinomycetia bacterium]|jgi:hypothetical protein|nr:hypothetical protein [Actinomycetes bacterium]MDQ1653802.1 hypothetical protein [Cryptosporangiaceae bacterium]MDQ1657495.1 hypothetical protein [Cryptosporangiaceae bacterium]